MAKMDFTEAVNAQVDAHMVGEAMSKALSEWNTKWSDDSAAAGRPKSKAEFLKGAMLKYLENV